MRHALRAFLGALAIGVSVAGAQMWFFDTPLTGAEEVPPSDSRATGRAMGTYNEATNVLRIMVNATGFESDILFGHIHGWTARYQWPRGVRPYEHERQLTSVDV